MKWEEVRKLYPDQYVKLNILDFHVEGDKKIITDVEPIHVIDNPKTATKELLLAKCNTVVYHTGTREIMIEIRKKRLSGIKEKNLNQ